MIVYVGIWYIARSYRLRLTPSVPYPLIPNKQPEQNVTVPDSQHYYRPRYLSLLFTSYIITKQTATYAAEALNSSKAFLAISTLSNASPCTCTLLLLPNPRPFNHLFRSLFL